jgi:streptogramin lyase
VGAGPIGVATAPGAVWVADAVGGAVSKVDPVHLRVVATYAVGAGGTVLGTEPARAALGHGVSDPLTVAYFGGLVWIGDGRAGTLSALDPATGREHDAPVTLPGLPRHVVAADGGLWLTTANPGRVLEVNTS